MKLLIAFLISVFSIYKFEEKKSTVYIYRDAKFVGLTINYDLQVDGISICSLSNNRIIKLELPIGKHEISAKSKGVAYLSNPKTSFSFENYSDKNTLIIAKTKMKGVAGVLDFQISNDEGIIENSKIDNCQKKKN